MLPVPGNGVSVSEQVLLVSVSCTLNKDNYLYNVTVTKQGRIFLLVQAPSFDVKCFVLKLLTSLKMYLLYLITALCEK